MPVLKENALISIIQHPPVPLPKAPESITGKGQDREMTDHARRELTERLHEDNVCYTGLFS
jgi:hypothetical protein